GHEARAKAILETNHPDMFVSASHELSQEYREFERCSTVVANAYIGPKVRRYLGEIDQHIRGAVFSGSFLIVQSTGGLYEAAQALPVQIAMMDIFEVGTGGGSIARMEEGGLRVGPQSAGAAPGPACYGLGGIEATVTDANLVLGRLAADRFLGGEMQLDMASAERAIARVGKPLDLNLTATADGILRIAATT